MNLNYPVTMFKNKVMDWASRREGMDIAVTHVKQTALPAVVFPDGEPGRMPRQGLLMLRNSACTSAPVWATACLCL